MGSYEKLVDRSRELATEAHKGQKRKGNGEPYVNHPKRVANHFTSDIAQAAAYLHDVLEDTRITEHDLVEEQIPGEIIEIVKLLTRNKERESYYDFIMTILRSRNKWAILIKKADLEDNISDLEEGSLKDKYRLALHVIDQEIERIGLLKVTMIYD